MSDELPSQLLAAISLASNPHQATDQSQVSSALTFLEQCKENSNQTWHAGWTVFTANADGPSGSAQAARHSPDARMFALNLVSDFLENK